jgi:hypothetical protein
MLAVLVLSALVVLPKTACSAVVETWHAGTVTSCRVLNTGGDLYGNGSYQMVTGEPASGGTERVAVRSGATGAILAQSALSYKVGQMWLADVDGDGHAEIVFSDTVTGKLNCLNYSPGPSTLAVRWSFVASTAWQMGDLDENGSLEMITVEPAAGGGQVVAARSASTGVLQAQTAPPPVQPYHVGQVWVADLDGDGHSEILFSDQDVHTLNCLTYAPSPSTLAVRWSYVAEPWVFVDLDGNGKLYVAFMEATTDPFCFIYDRNGNQVAHFKPAGAPAGTSYIPSLRPDDYDVDGRQELLIDYHSNLAPGSDILYVFKSNTPVSVELAGDSRRLELGASFPNPSSGASRIGYSLPSAGLASLRMFDVAGRAVRTLVDGKVQAGPHEAIWDGRDDHGQLLRAGTYFCELNAGGQRETRSIVRLR